jgi:hypothetical protein
MCYKLPRHYGRNHPFLTAAAHTPAIVFFCPTIFLSAFLLFCCEPMIGKMMFLLLGCAAAV